MANKLKELALTSVDLVTSGSNPDAKICLFKRRDGVAAVDEDETVQPVAETLLEKCIAAIAGVFGKSTEGKVEIEGKGEDGYTEGKINKGCNDTQFNQEEATDTMRIDKSRMTPEELAAIEAIEKKYGVAEPEGTGAAGIGDVAKGAEDNPPAGAVPADAAAAAGGNNAEMHPEVKKALADMEAVRKAQTAEIDELKKSLEMEKLSAVAKKYEVLGKKADELAPKLYDLRKAGGTAYDDYVGLLDEQITLVEKSGVFGEIGTDRSGKLETGDELGNKAAEIRKANAGMSTPEAIAKAFEENPELAERYDRDYMSGRVR